MIGVAGAQIDHLSYPNNQLPVCRRGWADCGGMAQRLPDRCLRLLTYQCGVIADWQAEAAGLNGLRMRDQVRSGRWQRLHLGTYAAFTGKPPREAVLWGAVLRAGPRAILSHETAAELDGLVEKRSKLIHVTVPQAQHRQPIAGLVIHRTRRSVAVRRQGRLPLRTATEETLLDLAQVADSFDDVVALLARACQRRLTTPFLISDTLQLRARVRWRTEIEQALKDVDAGAHSVLEYRYLRDVERPHALPVAERQVKAIQNGGVIYRDALYRRYGVAVELDGKANHQAEHDLRDRRRDNLAAVDGIVTLRYGWAAVTENPCETAREVAAVLAGRGWPGPVQRCGPNCRA
jgi:hypothetical protein